MTPNVWVVLEHGSTFIREVGGSEQDSCLGWHVLLDTPGPGTRDWSPYSQPSVRKTPMEAGFPLRATWRMRGCPSGETSQSPSSIVCVCWSTAREHVTVSGELWRDSAMHAHVSILPASHQQLSLCRGGNLGSQRDSDWTQAAQDDMLESHAWSLETSYSLSSVTGKRGFSQGQASLWPSSTETCGLHSSGVTARGWRAPKKAQVGRCHRASLIAQWVKNLPAMQKTPVWFLGQEGPLEKG